MAGTCKECDGDGGVRGGGSSSTLSPDLMRKEDTFEFCGCEDGNAGGCLALFGQTCYETDTHTVDQNKR